MKSIIWLSIISTVILTNCTTPDYFSKAKNKMDKEKYEQAIHLLSKAIQKDNSDYQYFLYRGKCYFLLNDYKSAVIDLTSVINLIPDSSFAYYNRAKCYFALNLLDSSLTDINRAIELDSCSFNLLFKALILHRKNDTIQFCDNLLLAEEYTKYDYQVNYDQIDSMRAFLSELLLTERFYILKGYIVVRKENTKYYNSGYSFIYYPDNKLFSKIEIKNYEKNGVELTYYKDGTLRDSSYFVNGKIDGESISFYNNGSIQSVWNWEMGKLEGKVEEWDKNGIKTLEAIYHNNLKNGKYSIWDESGLLLLEENYFNDTLNGYSKVLDIREGNNNYIIKNYNMGIEIK